MKRVILSPNPYRDRNFRTVRAAWQILQEAGMDTRLCLPFEVERGCEPPADMPFTRLEKELPGAEAVICFGGDGTLLHMAKSAARLGIPILGVNIGTMGFLAELESGELQELRRLAVGSYRLESRMMLDVTVQRGGQVLCRDVCLNDVAVTKGAVGRVVHLAVQCDGVQALTCSGDGLVVSTPTGSTAYNLSAGGPIAEPEAHSILVTPICAHDIVSNRCLVTAPNRVITVSVVKNARRCAYLSVDGGKTVRLGMGDVATIRKSRLETRLIRLKERSFFDVVNGKFRTN